LKRSIVLAVAVLALGTSVYGCGKQDKTEMAAPPAGANAIPDQSVKKPGLPSAGPSGGGGPAAGGLRPMGPADSK
jgi:predicted small lipoprotein YifL